MPSQVQQHWILYRSHRQEHAPQTAAVLLCIFGLVFRSFNFLCPINAREDALLFEQQQNKVSEMENARVAAVKVEAVAEQENNKFEQNKVSVVTEKKKVADIQVNQIVKAVAKKKNIRKQGKKTGS